MHEFDLIKRITHGIPIQGEGLIHGVGDDCAVVEGNWLVTVDGLLEDVHFKRRWTDWRLLGRKVLSVNISDVAAMGGRPIFFLVTIGIPEGTDEKSVMSIFDGIASVAASHKMTLIGGDTCQSKSGVVISITVLGQAGRNIIYRRGAGEGDAIMVTGTIGDAAVGHALLEAGVRGLDAMPFIKKFSDPIPRVAAGQWLAASGCVSSMIDVSDGLIADLGHIAEASGVGIELDTNKLPLSNGYQEMARQAKKDPTILAITGGEDYELAFTVKKDKLGLFQKMLKTVGPTFGYEITQVGWITPKEKGFKILDVHGKEMKIARTGFEHKF